MTDRDNEDRPDNPNPYRPGQRQQPKGQGGQHSGGQPGLQAGRQHHAAEEYTAQDREQAYGQSFDRGHDETLYGARSGHSQTSRSTQAQSGGGSRDYPRQGSGGGGYQGSYGGSMGRQQGEGYGSSSGYGSPDSDRYGGSSYQGTAFVSPGDTQQSHSGMGRQSYSGMGPKNYTRSDERLTEDLCERLTMDPDVDASDIEVKVAQGTATLEGTVSQRWMKHRAEDVADGCSGVRNVENRIKVKSESSYGGGSEQRSSGSQTETRAGQTGSSTGPGTAH